LYRSSKIFVLPSLIENFPVVLLEALAAGCAVVTTSGTGCVEVVGSAGVLVEPGDAAGLHEALVRLMGDEDEICRLQESALERSRRFDWSVVAGEFGSLFQKHVGTTPPSSYPDH
jgi:glycosyltransferase involved in cell wall biosynthesis